MMPCNPMWDGPNVWYDTKIQTIITHNWFLILHMVLFCKFYLDRLHNLKTYNTYYLWIIFLWRETKHTINYYKAADDLKPCCSQNSSCSSSNTVCILKYLENKKCLFQHSASTVYIVPPKSSRFISSVSVDELLLVHILMLPNWLCNSNWQDGWKAGLTLIDSCWDSNLEMSFQPLKARVFRALAEKCVTALSVRTSESVCKKPSAGREHEWGCVWELDEAPWASEHLINPNSSSLNEGLITLTDSLKTRRQRPQRLMLTYSIWLSGQKGRAFTLQLKSCMCAWVWVCAHVYVCACSSVPKTVVSSTHFPHRARRSLCLRGSSLRTSFP